MKALREDLATSIEVPFARVDCLGNELKYLQEVLESGWLTTASKAEELEAKFAQFLGVKHALAVNSCTSALHLAMEALEIKSGDKVLIPTMTFTATAEVVRYLGAIPVLLDVDPRTSLVSETIVVQALKNHPDAKALVVVHYGGQAALMTSSAGDGIVDHCRKNGVKIVEDAAHAFPTKLNGNYVGTFGDITCFSFYANKTMTTGEGGMVVTQSNELAARMRIMRLHGIDRDIWRRYTEQQVSWEYDVVAPGYKYNMPDLNAAVGLAQLERVEASRQLRTECALRYIEAFKKHPQIHMLDCLCHSHEHSWHLFPILLQGDLAAMRNDFIEIVTRCRVGVSVHYKPLHRLSYYRDTFGFRTEDYPGAEYLWKSTVSLPIYASLTNVEQEYVISAVASAIRELT